MSVEDIRQVIEEAAALALLGPEGRGVRLEMAFAPDMPPVFIDKVLIQQVLLNLIRNAVEAMHDEPAPRADHQDDAVGRSHGRGQRGRQRSGPCRRCAREAVPAVRDDKAVRHGSRLVDLPRHRGGAWRPDVARPIHPSGGADFHFTLPVAGADAAGTGAGDRGARA